MVEVKITEDIKVGGNNPCFIIAEVGQNHQGDIGIAKKLIRAAKVCDVLSISSKLDLKVISKCFVVTCESETKQCRLTSRAANALDACLQRNKF